MLLLKNAEYLAPQGGFKRADILIDGEKIADIDENITPVENCEVIDVKGLKVLPGFVDIHFHGAVGNDVMYANKEELQEISSYLAKEGTTSYMATTITSSLEELIKALENIKEASEAEVRGATIVGTHIEGPYISPKQKGCHETAWMRQADIKDYEKFKKILGEKLRVHLTVAPEIEGAIEFIDYVTEHGGTISIGHTDAQSDKIKEAISRGANSFTHLFNAMRGIHHREPGVAGTALNSDAYVELICDGIHVHPDVVNLIYRLKGVDRIVLVTDAMQAAGLGDGEYFFGGFKVKVIDGIARKEDGTLASSTLTILKAVKNMMKLTGAALEEAVKMATINPAKVIGIDTLTGSIEINKRADLLVINDSLEPQAVFCRGNRTK